MESIAGNTHNRTAKRNTPNVYCSPRVQGMDAELLRKAEASHGNESEGGACNQYKSVNITNTMAPASGKPIRSHWSKEMVMWACWANSPTPIKFGGVPISVATPPIPAP